MILQNENGRHRLKDEFTGADNDVDMGKPTAWHRNGSFTQVEDFDWKAFNNPASGVNCKVSNEDVADAIARR